MKKLFIFSTIATFFFGCCAQKNTKPQTEVSNSLFDKNWKLVELNGKVVETEAFMSLNSVDNRVSGNLGCNNFSGTFEINGNLMKFSQMVATRKMCLSSMEIEDGFDTAMNNTDYFEIKNGTLLLKQGKKTLAVLE